MQLMAAALLRVWLYVYQALGRAAGLLTRVVSMPDRVRGFCASNVNRGEVLDRYGAMASIEAWIKPK